MDLQLTGKKALVTGSTAGIGFATAHGLAREGVSVVVNGRTPARVDAAVKRIRQAVPSAEVTGVAADLGSAEGCALLTGRVRSVDILVNNMGIFEPKPFEQIPDKDWMRFFDGMTKTAQVAVARGIAETTAGTGVTVNSVLPGPTKSEGVAGFVAQIAEQRGIGFAAMEREFFETARPSSLLRRFATVEEVANLIVYLCSPLASATNGAALRVDGGVVRSAL
jgi:hypothetical protein